jgi:hypothetical protein
VTEPTADLILAFRKGWDVDEDDQHIRNGLGALFAAMGAGLPLAEEPVWADGRKLQLTLEMENDVKVDAAALGEADRPSEVVRLLRAAADDIEETWREALAAYRADSNREVS